MRTLPRHIEGRKTKRTVTAKKLDLRKEFKHLHSPSATEAEIIEAPEMKFIMVNGTGDPNKSAMFQDVIGAVYSLSYTLKFMIRQEQAIDYPVMALEGLWWTDDPSGKFSLNNKKEWKWTLMIMQPKLITDDLFGRALKLVEQKKSSLDTLRKARLESFYEGLSAQIMRIGPYSAEEPTIAKLHNYIRERGYNPRGKHHEIYLGDPRRAAPSNLKTILRHPVERR